MRKKIKIIENSSTPHFTKIVNEHLKKGWKIKGNIAKYGGCFTAILHK